MGLCLNAIVIEDVVFPYVDSVLKISIGQRLLPSQRHAIMAAVGWPDSNRSAIDSMNPNMTVLV